jgi:hypothetical protein
MRWHWHNENANGSGLLHGRAWFYLTDNLVFNPEWTFGAKSSHTGIGIKFGGDERTVQLHLGIAHLFGLFLSLDGAWPRRWRFGKYGEQEREFAVSWYEGHFNISIAYDWTEGSHYGDGRDIWTQPGSRHWSICPMDILFGRPKYQERVIETVPVDVAMPEGSYHGTCKIFESTWVRPRLPWFPRRLRRSTVDIPKGIPVSGKGENSWDCGEDAIFGQTSATPTVNAAIGELVKSALSTRERYGGRNWKPELRMN